MPRAKFWTCLVIAAVASLGALPAFAKHNAVETSLNDVVLPSTAGGTLVLRPCETCAPTSIRVTSQSRYFIGGNEVTLQELVAESQRRAMSLVVSYDTRTLELLTIKVWL
ncbi:MAG TPA: hypothetical protein VG994_07235 [Steroidobacteraceae bacterium]|nr:hypothetical protein [Steroidobacteraceae bacterium]